MRNVKTHHDQRIEVYRPEERGIYSQQGNQRGITSQDETYFNQVGRDHVDEYIEIAEEALGMVKWVGGFLMGALGGFHQMKQQQRQQQHQQHRRY